MTNKRIKDLTVTSPVDGKELVPFDSTGTGTVSVQLNDLVKFGLQNMTSGPTIGVDWNFTGRVLVITPSASNEAANKQFVIYPSIRVVSGSSDTLTTSDIGNVIAYTQTGSILINFANLSSGYPVTTPSSSAQILMQFEHSASLPIISASGGTTINGSTTPITGSTGYGLMSFSTRNGLNWFK